MNSAAPNTGDLVRLARAGDAGAWRELTARYSGLLWSVARGFHLGAADAGDVVQMCWVRLVENLDRIRDPEHVATWLVTVARRESISLIRRSGRESLSVSDRPHDLVDVDPPIETAMIRSERDRALWAAFEQVSERCQRLLRLLISDPPMAYRDIADVLDMPIGAIGPTRQRCLSTLRGRIASAGAQTLELLSSPDPEPGDRFTARHAPSAGSEKGDQ
jgi:RNA polymerase sigma factor (sigma-70 family)